MKNLKTPDVTADLRPKGRGRPQRILLGQWPEEHVREVIRAVVFREVSRPAVRAVQRDLSHFTVPEEGTY